jgi:hypothetical protein
MLLGCGQNIHKFDGNPNVTQPIITLYNSNMANGPPTPPPTTAVELIDEAREKAMNTQPAPVATEPQQQQQPSGHDPFQEMFPTITNLAAQGKFLDLINVAEQTEINVRFIDCSWRISRFI